MSAGTTNRREPDHPSVESPTHQSLIDKAVEHGGHRRIGPLWELVSHEPARVLATRFLPEDVHHSAFEITELRRTAAARLTCTRIADAHLVRTSCGAYIHDLIPKTEVVRCGFGIEVFTP